MKNFLLGIAILGMLASCGSKKAGKSDNALSGTIKIDGSSTVYPVSEAVAEEFRTEAPKVKVTVGVSGTGGGFKKFGRGETDISDASRPIKDKEATICKESGINYVELTVAYDGLAVIINPENKWVDKFTTEELKKLWEPAAEGKIMKWSDIREGWPNENINLYGPDAASGTYDYFIEAIVGKGTGSRGDYSPSADDNVLVQGVATDKYALGFFGLAYFEENKDKLQLVAVDNGSGPVIPTQKTVAEKTYSPLSRPIFIYVNSTSIKRPEVVKFVEYYMTQAAELVSDVGYIALPSAEYAEELNEFKTFVTQNK